MLAPVLPNQRVTEEFQQEYLEANTIPRWTAAMEGAAKARAAAAR